MKTTPNFPFSVVIISLFLFFFSVDNISAQDVTIPSPVTPPSVNGSGKGGHHRGHGPWNRNRVTRDAPPPIELEDKLKEFAAKLGKTPDDLRSAFGKFMLAQGISIQQMEEAVQRGNQVALQMIENVKKAMHT